MNKIFALLLCAPCIALAASKPGNVNDDTTGIVTPDIATSFLSTESFTNDANGDLVVCVPPSEKDGNTCNRDGMPKNYGWVKASASIPKGKTYIGFKVVSGSYGYRRVEIYWK